MVVFFVAKHLGGFSTLNPQVTRTAPCRVQDQWFTRVKSDEGGKSSYKEECIYEGKERNLGDGNKGYLFNVCPGGPVSVILLISEAEFFAVFMIDG